MLVDRDAHGGRRCGSLYFDVTSGEGYAASYLFVEFPPASQTVTFWAKSPGRVALVVRICDSTGQWHQMPLMQKQSAWHKVTLDLAKPWPIHFQGQNDGVIHQPIKQICFLRDQGSEPKTGTIYIDDIEASTTAPAQELVGWYWQRKGPKIVLQTGVTGSLYYPADQVRARITALPTPPKELNLKVTARIFDAAKQKVAELKPVTLTAGNNYADWVDMPRVLGYYHVVLTATDDTHSSVAKASYAVIPANPALHTCEPGSPFGVNTHFNQGWPAEIGAIVKRAGIAWIRDGEASMDDRALPVAKSNSLCYMPCITTWTMPLVEMLKAERKKNPNAETFDFSEAVEWYRRFAAKYGKDIDAYDLANEPHGAWSSALGGGWWGGPWLKTFSDFGRQVSAAIRSADPGALIVWEDIDRLLWYKDFIKYGASDAIDVISPHPYNLHQAKPEPEDQVLLTTFGDFNQICKTNNLKWKVWSGEVGFSSFQRDKSTATPFYSSNTEDEQARKLVRMMVLELAAGVDKIFWYDFKNDGWDPHNPEHNFGLVRADLLPKPALVAYANFISRTRGGKWLGRYNIGSGAEAFAYILERSKVPALVAWSRQSAQEALPVTSDVAAVTVTDIYGRGQSVPVKNHLLSLKFSTSPIYIDGLTFEDIHPLISGR